ncbi:MULTISPECIES: hypothetical protein [Streptomyces]|uniref:hypothetical protein n=1 Tax=Streptomyces TaxID=1883 RepID=UPI0005271489|nr:MULTISPECIES: hypothetical protein [Streptomyces]
MVGGCGFADEAGEPAAADAGLSGVLVVLVVVAEAALVVGFVAFLVKEPAAVDAGEEVFEEVGGGAFGAERGQAQAGGFGVGVRAGVFGEVVVEVPPLSWTA